MDKHGFFQALRINKYRKFHNIMDLMSFKLNGTNQLDLKLKHRKVRSKLQLKMILVHFPYIVMINSQTKKI